MWSTPPTTRVAIGDRLLPSGLLVSAAALEIAVHGWDVGRATGEGRDLPEDLAAALMPVARAVVTDDAGRKIAESPECRVEIYEPIDCQFIDTDGDADHRQDYIDMVLALHRGDQLEPSTVERITAAAGMSGSNLESHLALMAHTDWDA